MVVDTAAVGEMPVQAWACRERAGVAQWGSAAVAPGVEAEHQRKEGVGKLAMVAGLAVGAYVSQQQPWAFCGADLEVKVFGGFFKAGLCLRGQKACIAVSLAF